MSSSSKLFDTTLSTSSAFIRALRCRFERDPSHAEYRSFVILMIITLADRPPCCGCSSEVGKVRGVIVWNLFMCHSFFTAQKVNAIVIASNTIVTFEAFLFTTPATIVFAFFTARRFHWGSDWGRWEILGKSNKRRMCAVCFLTIIRSGDIWRLFEGEEWRDKIEDENRDAEYGIKRVGEKSDQKVINPRINGT